MRRKSPTAKTNSQYEARLTEVWRLWNRGQRQWQIAAALGITDRQVRYDLKTLENRWRAETGAGMAAHKEAQLARIEELFKTYWSSWQTSLNEKQTTSTEKSYSGEDDAGARRKAAIKKESRDGNAAYLAGVQWCISEVCKIRGIYAPVTLDLSRMTTEDLIRLAQSIFSAGPHEPGTAGEGQAVSPECSS